MILTEEGWFAILLCTTCGTGFMFAIVQHILNSCISRESASCRVAAGNGFAASSRAKDTPVSEDFPLLNQKEQIFHGSLIMCLEDYNRLAHFHSIVKFGNSLFVQTQYSLCLSITCCFSLIIFTMSTWAYQNTEAGLLTALAYFLGSISTMIVHAFGLAVALTNSIETAVSSHEFGFKKCFISTFRTGCCIGFGVVSFGVLAMFGSLILFQELLGRHKPQLLLYTCFTGFGLGASVIAMFMRLGGGLFANATGIVAGLANLTYGIPECDSRNPAAIGSIVGCSVSRIAGMLSDFFGSWVESTCAVLLLMSMIEGLHPVSIMCPLLMHCAGIVVSMATSFLATAVDPANRIGDINTSLRLQLIVTSLLMVPCAMIISFTLLPASFEFQGLSTKRVISTTGTTFTLVLGVFAGLFHSLITEYFTNNTAVPVKRLAKLMTSANASEMLYGMSIGYRSVLPSVLTLALSLYLSFIVADIFGIALLAIGMVSTMPIYLTIGTFSALSDNAFHLVELSKMRREICKKAAGMLSAGSNLTAISKGITTASATMSSLALYGAFVVQVEKLTGQLVHIGILEALPVCFLFIGSAIPYWITSATLKSVKNSVSVVASAVDEMIASQADLVNPVAESPNSTANHIKIINIATEVSFQEMLEPALISALLPLFVGTFFGIHALLALIAGTILTSLPLSITICNTGEAYASAKRSIARDFDLDKTSHIFKSALLTDSYGNPMKDTSGPALNILMKMMAMSALVFSPFLCSMNNGRGLLDVSVE